MAQKLSKIHALVLLCSSALVSAFRPVQYESLLEKTYKAISLVNYFNQSTQQSDLYVEIRSAWYQSSAEGWTAIAFGSEMRGSLMFILYGDPAASKDSLTLSVRTTTSHTSPRPVEESNPVVEVAHTQFEEWNGHFKTTKQSDPPSHIGIARFIIRGYTQWHSTLLSNSSERQAMIWAHNPDEDFRGSLSFDTRLQVHDVVNGMGFIWVDLKHASSPLPIFWEIQNTFGRMGVSDKGTPAPPSESDLAIGAKFLADEGYNNANPLPESTQESFVPGATTSHSGLDGGSLPLFRSIRHLHGIAMLPAILFFYPLSIYLTLFPKAERTMLPWKVQLSIFIFTAISSLLALLDGRPSNKHIGFGTAVICASLTPAISHWWRRQSSSSTELSKMTDMHVWGSCGILFINLLMIVVSAFHSQYVSLYMTIMALIFATNSLLLVLMVKRVRSRRFLRSMEEHDLAESSDTEESSWLRRSNEGKR